MSLSSRRRTDPGRIDTLRRAWRVAALLVLAGALPAQAQTLTTVRVSGGELRAEGERSRVTGGYVDPRTGRGRIEHRGGALRLRRVRRVRTNGLTTRIVTRSGVRLRLRLAQILLAGGTTTVTVDPALGVTAMGGTFTIAGGRLDAGTLTGTVGHRGELTLTRDGRAMTFFDLGLAMPAVTAQMWDFRAPLATLSALQRSIAERSLRLRATATLADLAARELNESFETGEFRAGMPLGTVTVRGRLRG